VLVLALGIGGAAAQSLGDAEDIDIPVAPAPKPRSDGDDWGFDNEDELDLTVDDDVQMKDFVAEQKKKAPPPVWFHLDVAGKVPLRDDFDIQIDAYNQSFVVVELPVLVSITRGTFATEHPNGIRLVAEVTSGPLKRVITETIAPGAVFEALPTFVFLKTALPTAAPTGEIRYVIKVAELPAPADPAAKGEAPPTPALRDLFARTTVFRRP
jgi:hypothetical protein